MASPYDFVLQLMKGTPGGVDTSQQQGFIQNMMPDLSGLQGFQPSQQAFQGLMGFNPQMSGAVRGGLEGIISDPWGGGAAKGTLEEMLSTGRPTDVSGIGEAAARRGNLAFEQLTGGAQEQAAISGGLASSGFANKQAGIAGNIADMIQSRMLEAGVGAQESAAGRSLAALNPALAARGMGMQAAGTLGGLEGMFSGQRLGALGQAAGAEQGINAQMLQKLLGTAGLDLAGKSAQAGAGQNLLNFMGTQTGAGGPGMNAANALSLLRSVGETQGGVDVNIMQQMMSLMGGGPKYNEPGYQTQPSGTSGGYGANPTLASTGTGAFASKKFEPAAYGGGAPRFPVTTEGMKGVASGGAGPYGPVVNIPPGKPMASYTPPTFSTPAEYKAKFAAPSGSAAGTGAITDWDAYSKLIAALGASGGYMG